MTRSSDFSSDSWRCRWVCPDPEPLSFLHHDEFTFEMEAISNSFSRASAIDCVGLEIRIAMMVALGCIDSSESDNDYCEQRCRFLFLRPSLEPIAISYWNRIVDLDINIVTANKIVSALTIKEQVLRKGEGVGRSKSGNVGFELPARARGWLDRLRDVRSQPNLASFMPAFTFASTVMAHPFSDGNGRLARILTLGALAKYSGWDAPIIALAPSFYRHAENLGASLDELSLTGNWEPYITVFIRILRDANDLMSRLSRLSRL